MSDTTSNWWKEYEMNKISQKPVNGSGVPLEEVVIDAILQCKDGPVLRSNLSLLTPQQRPSSEFQGYFLIDNEDYGNYLRHLQKTGSSQADPQEVQCIKTFSRIVDKKVFYLRKLPKGRVLANEALDMLPILLERHEGHISEEDREKIVQKLRDQFSAPRKCYYTFDLEEVEVILKTFFTDSSQEVAIVPDIILAIKKNLVQTDYSIFLNTFAPDGSYVMDASQALIEYFFRYVLKRRPKPVPEALKMVKTGFMETFCSYGSTFFVRSSNCILEKLHPESPELEEAAMEPFFGGRNDAYVYYINYQRYCICSDLPPYPKSWFTEISDDIPVWLMRYYLVAGMWQSFAPERTDIKEKLLDALEETFLVDSKFHTEIIKKQIIESDGTTLNEVFLSLQEPVTPEFVQKIWSDLPRKTQTKFKTLEDECLKIIFEDVTILFNYEDPGPLVPKLEKIAKMNKEVRRFINKKKPPLEAETKLPVEVYDFCWVEMREVFFTLTEKIQEILSNRPSRAVLESENDSELASSVNDQSCSKDSLPVPEEVQNPSEDVSDENGSETSAEEEKSEAGAPSIESETTEEYDEETEVNQKKTKLHKKSLAHQKTSSEPKKPAKLSESLVKTLTKTRWISGRNAKADPLYRKLKAKKAAIKQAESASCRKCHRMSKRLRIVRKKWRMAKLLLANFRGKVEMYDELEAAITDVMKMLEKQNGRVKELEEINANQVKSESAVLYNAAVQNHIKSLEAKLEDKQYEIEALRTNLPPPVSPQEFNKLKAALEEESTMRGIAEKQNQLLIKQTVTLKQENEILKRESGIVNVGGEELEVLKIREKAKDLELEALRRKIEELTEDRKVDEEREKAKDLELETFRRKIEMQGRELNAIKNREKNKDLELEALRRELEVFREESKINAESIRRLIYENKKLTSESSSEKGSSSSSPFRYQ